MSKYDTLLGGFIIVSTVSTPLLIFTLCILFRETPKAMKTYRWMLVNAQVCSYLETIYYALLMAPIPESYPIVHTYCIGLLSRVFRPPVSILMAIEVYLHTLIAASMLIAISYRHRQLCVFADNWFHRFIVKNGARIVFIYGYITQPTIGTFLVYFAHTSDAETRAAILKLDPEHVFPSAVSAYGKYANLWGLCLTAGATGVIILFVFFVYDSSRILKSKASSNRTAALHKEAVNTLIIQMCLMEVSSVFSAFVIAIGLFAKFSSEQGNLAADIYLITNGLLYSLKSVCCTLAILLVHKPYRVALKKMFQKENAEVSRVSRITSFRPSVVNPIA